MASKNIVVEDYTKEGQETKAFIVRGDTKPIKNELKALGGRWNPYLVAWVFSMKKKKEVQSFLSGETKVDTTKQVSSFERNVMQILTEIQKDIQFLKAEIVSLKENIVINDE